LNFVFCNAGNALYPRDLKVVCVRTIRHLLYSYLHAEYRQRTRPPPPHPPNRPLTQSSC
jgi:hypothetical protein